MEFVRDGNKYRNGYGEIVELEENYLYSMLKGSEVANGALVGPKRRMLVTQKFIGEDTNTIKDVAPKTWEYLTSHAEALDKRRSSIYKERPRFSIFGVGDYSFADWKVAIAGLYKRLLFRAIGPVENKPVVFDDTVYFIPCEGEEQAQALKSLLNSEVAREFLEAFIFWDSKRPVTINVLRRLNLVALAKELCDKNFIQREFSTYQIKLFSQLINI
jgi:hypothetical protein